jgi:hypothetical protein
MLAPAKRRALPEKDQGRWFAMRRNAAALPVEDQFFYNLKMSAVMSKLAMLKVIAAEAECAPQ